MVKKIVPILYANVHMCFPEIFILKIKCREGSLKQFSICMCIIEKKSFRKHENPSFLSSSKKTKPYNNNSKTLNYYYL